MRLDKQATRTAWLRCMRAQAGKGVGRAPHAAGSCCNQPMAPLNGRVGRIIAMHSHLPHLHHKSACGATACAHWPGPTARLLQHRPGHRRVLLRRPQPRRPAAVPPRQAGAASRYTRQKAATGPWQPHPPMDAAAAPPPPVQVAPALPVRPARRTCCKQVLKISRAQN